mgnify:CR=1 FL=1
MRNKDRSEAEHLRGELRKLQSENKHLRRELKKLMNIQRNLEEFQEAFAEVSEEKHQTIADLTCPNCARGPYRAIAIPGNREVKVCKVCNYRETTNVDQQ